MKYNFLGTISSGWHTVTENTVSSTAMSTGFRPVTKDARYGIGASADMDSGTIVTPDKFSMDDNPLALNPTLGNAFRSPILTGRIAQGQWTFSIKHKIGVNRIEYPFRFKFKVWKADADAGNETLLTPSPILSNIINTTTAGTFYTQSIAWTAPDIDIEKQYLYIAVAFMMSNKTADNSDVTKRHEFGLVRDTVLYADSAASYVNTPALSTVVATNNDLVGMMGI